MELFYNHGQNVNFPHISYLQNTPSFAGKSYPFISIHILPSCLEGLEGFRLFYVVSQVRASFQALGRPNADVAMGGADGPWMGTNVAQIDRFTRTKYIGGCSSLMLTWYS